MRKAHPYGVQGRRPVDRYTRARRKENRSNSQVQAKPAEEK